MGLINSIHSFVGSLNLPPLLIVGLMTGIAFYIGKSMKYIKLPSLIGFMVIGVILGPSLFNLLSEHMQGSLSFISEMALGFVAVSIGLELNMRSLKKQGRGIIIVILLESFMAFLLVFGVVFLFTKDLPLALIFGAIAPASAPAGTVAVIKEYRARGSLTQALYAVVGFDDGLGIIIFGFAAAFARAFLVQEAGGAETGVITMMLIPLKEVFLSLVSGGLGAVIFIFFARRLRESRDVFILLFAMTLALVGLSEMWHMSLILTNMVLGFIVVNTQDNQLLQKLHTELEMTMPLLFILFFVLAGANLHVSALPSLGLLGLLYVLARSTGLVSGAAIGATLGKMAPKIRKYLGMGILSQAGVAIGLALIVKNEFGEFGSHGAAIGATVITTVTATCIFFELIGPILTKIGLEKAGVIKVEK